MRRDLWKELATRARKARQSCAVEEKAPFRFEDRVLTELARTPRKPWNPLAPWLALVKPAVGLAFAITTVCLLYNVTEETKSQNDSIRAELIVQTESLIQMAVLQNE